MHKKILAITLITAASSAAVAYALSGSAALAAGLSLPALLGGLIIGSTLADRERLRRARREAADAHRQVMAVHRESLQAHIRREAGARIDQVATGALAPDDVNYIYRRIRSGIVNKVYKDTHRLN